MHFSEMLISLGEYSQRNWKKKQPKVPKQHRIYATKNGNVDDIFL